MFQVQATVTKISTFADHSLRLQVDTDRELSAEENALVFSLYNKSGWFIFKETEIRPDEIEVPEYVKEFKEDKTPSQRLRAVLYLLWKQSKQGTADDFYKRKMEEVIEHFKSKLE
jgi:hypothetical protein